MVEPIAVVFPRRRGAPWIPKVPGVRPRVKRDPVCPDPPKPSIRHHGHPCCSDRFYDADESEFILAVERFQREKNKRFPSLAELLGVLKSLGYVKTQGGGLSPPCDPPIGPLIPLVKVAVS